MGFGFIDNHHEQLAAYLPRGVALFTFGLAFFALGIYNTFLNPDRQ